MNEALGKDNRELEACSRQALLRVLATTNLAHVAPYLALARVIDRELVDEGAVTIRVRDAKLLPQEGYTVVRMSFVVDLDVPESKRCANTVLYTFRNLSSQALEPFVYAGKLEDGWEVFAYSTDEEFLAERLTGEEGEAVLTKVKEKALARGMRSLARYVDLMERAVKESKAVPTC
ncbi:hypothetical protein [Desulfothermobacter acidiphilus]|uniref:hypothetical protein n=1 Tax=Desulfothermobacter acidiphilus TaxID=1938353 RepID=UPI003F8AE13A